MTKEIDQLGKIIISKLRSNTKALSILVGNEKAIKELDRLKLF